MRPLICLGGIDYLWGLPVGALALALADRLYVLEKDAVRYSGAAAELREDKALVDRLLSP
jgi:hypothetical protein